MNILDVMIMIIDQSPDKTHCAFVVQPSLTYLISSQSPDTRMHMATGPTTHAPLRTPTRGNHGQSYHLINMIIFNIIALIIINNHKNKHHDYQNQIDSVKGVQLKLLKMVM